LYFLLPLFVYFTKKYRFIAKYLVVIGFVIELSSQVLIKHFEISLPVPLFFSYIASFLFGGWIAIHYDRFKDEWTKRQLTLAFIGMITLGLAYTAGYYYINILGLSFPYLPFKALAIIYFLVASFVLFKTGIYLHNHSSKRVLNWTERLRLYSFGFYLVHPFILHIWKTILVAENSWQFHAFIFIRYIVVCICCYIFIRIIHGLFPKAWFLFGKLPHPKVVRKKYL
ncbi:MAG: acyltransferase family protein, partial [Lysinibacillus sp.]